MAYYIDEVKKTAVKAEGKTLFGWNHETRRFDLPVADSTPKCRMKRCSDFEARLYLFENDPSGCRERIRTMVGRLDDGVSFENDVNSITLESAEANLREVEEKRNAVMPEVTALQAKVDEYGLSMSEPGQCLSAYIQLLDKDIEIAHQDVIIAQFKKGLERAEGK